MQFLAREGVFDKGLKFRPMTLPDTFIDHDRPETQIVQAGLGRAGILTTVLKALAQTEAGSPPRASPTRRRRPDQLDRPTHPHPALPRASTYGPHRSKFNPHTET